MSSANQTWNSGVFFAVVLLSICGVHGEPTVNRVLREPVPSETAILLSGPTEHLRSVIAGSPPTAELRVVPVPAKVGAYPGGTTIVGNEMTAYIGGFRAWFEMRLKNWDPNGDGDPPVHLWQIGLDGSGFLGENAEPPEPGADIDRPFVLCTSNAQCIAAFGEPWALCRASTGFCWTAYVDRLGTGRPDSWCKDTGFGGCSTASCNENSDPGPICFGLLPTGEARPDDGFEYYGATVVLNLPQASFLGGKYSVGLKAESSYLGDTGSPTQLIPLLAMTGFEINFVAPSDQACCLQGGGCTDMFSPTCSLAGDAPQGPGSVCATTTCGPPTGACCDSVARSCVDGVQQTDCGPPLQWTPDVLCVGLEVPCLATGACCDSSPGGGGLCTDDQYESSCHGVDLTWLSDTPCSEVSCSEILGACCDLTPGGGGSCTDGTLQQDCTAPEQVWTREAPCADVECAESSASCCDTVTFACAEPIVSANCGGVGELWRLGVGCESCVSIPQVVVRPVAAKVGSYPPGTVINGQEILLPAGFGGTRIWFEAVIRSWDLDGNGSPPLEGFQVGLDRAGFEGANADPPNLGVDLALATVNCATNADCAAAFGEAWADCNPQAQLCKAAYVDRTGLGRPDAWCADTGSGSCLGAECDTVTPAAPRCYGFLPVNVSRPDQGIDYYGGTFVVDVPAGARGSYVVGLSDDATYLSDTANPPNFLPITKTGFIVSVRPPDLVPDVSMSGTRAVTIDSPFVVATSGSSGATAIGVRMASLQQPSPANPPCCPPPDFGGFEAATCSAPGESNSCIRWLGPPATVWESNANHALGSYTAARLQCTPYYTDWGLLGQVSIVGPEIVPSSTYELTAYSGGCKGFEATCAIVSAAVQVSTGRFGDVSPPFNPPVTTIQPDALDVVALVNKFRNLPTAVSKRFAQIQPNVLELNADINALDIVSVVDAFRGLAYPYSGPCACPSNVTCNATPCTAPTQCSGGLCVKTCLGGTNTDQPCITDAQCPGSACGTGFCRDRCGRCN